MDHRSRVGAHSGLSCAANSAALAGDRVDRTQRRQSMAGQDPPDRRGIQTEFSGCTTALSLTALSAVSTFCSTDSLLVVGYAVVEDRSAHRRLGAGAATCETVDRENLQLFSHYMAANQPAHAFDVILTTNRLVRALA